MRGLSDPKLYVSAAIALLDRGFGKPKQELDATVRNVQGGIDAPRPLRPEELDEWLARVRAQRAEQDRERDRKRERAEQEKRDRERPN